MERELDKLRAAGKDIARARRDARDPERPRLGVGVTIADQAADQAAVREVGDAAGPPIRGLAATLDGKPLEPFALVDVTAGDHRLAVIADGYFPASCTIRSCSATGRRATPIVTISR
jgi:hypothetical protein